MTTQKEIWRIVSINDNYLVSNQGRLFSLKTQKIMTPYMKKNQLVIKMYDGQRNYKIYRVHRLVCQAFLKGFDEERIVKHSNKDNTDNRITNLKQ